MNLEQQLEKSKAWMAEAAQSIDGLSFISTHKLRASLSLMHLCLEHQQGIHTLVDNGIVGSAFALYRPMLEAYVRGLWCLLCASDGQVDAFLRGGEPPPFGKLIEVIEQHPQFQGGGLSRIKKAQWTTLCAFTHGGSTQIHARNTADEIIVRYTEKHIGGLLRASMTISFLATQFMLTNTEQGDAALPALWGKFQELLNGDMGLHG